MSDNDFSLIKEPRQRRKDKIHEVKEFHPLVATWLSSNGYQYQHHYKMPDFGIVDFRAWGNDGKVMLVEAKCSHGKMKEAILQACVYRLQMPDTIAVVAVSSEFIGNGDVELAAKYDVRIITVDLSPELKARIDVERMRVKLLLSEPHPRKEFRIIHHPIYGEIKICPDCNRIVQDREYPIVLSEGC